MYRYVGSGSGWKVGIDYDSLGRPSSSSSTQLAAVGPPDRPSECHHLSMGSERGVHQSLAPFTV